MSSLIHQAPAETTRYMVAGYTVIFTIMFVYILSLVVRRRNLVRDLENLEELELTEQ